MKIAFCYPPFTKNNRFPNLPQNRQFIYTSSSQVKIYPVVMATAATWIKNIGHEILWLDGISRRLDWTEYEESLNSFSPDLIVLESKTPIMEKVWKYINKLKTQNPKVKIVLVGDHVSFFSEESFKKCKVDYILVGGDYDFLLIDLVKSLEKGIKYKLGKFVLNHDLDKTPVIDRELTRWKDYGEAYLYHPCAYVMFGRGCGIDMRRKGACTFCAWQHGLWQCSARLMSPERAILEVKNLINLGVKEIFDDTESGPLWNKSWMNEFYKLLKKEKLLGKISFSSNARGDQLDKSTCLLLKKIGYRLVKVGLESGSDQTLQVINKKETLSQIIQGVKNAKDAGLRVMLTIMTGYPWETETEVLKTYQVAKSLTLYKTKAGDCLQSSVVTPYPGTPLWKYAKSKEYFNIAAYDYRKYDMEEPILKTKINASYWCNKIWAIQRDPIFIIKSGLNIRSIKDFYLLLRGVRSLLGHLIDF